MTRNLLNRLPFARSVFAALFGIVTTAYGGVPSMDVTVFDASGKVAFKGPMSAHATFATRNLNPGRYVVQFNTKSASVKENQYLLVVSAGKKKVIAANVSGETFIAGGAALRVDVGAGLKITGQVADEQAVARGDGAKYRVIDGTRLVWVTAELGSNRGGHWVEQGLAPAGNINLWTSDDFRKKQDKGGEGSMLNYSRLHPDGY